MNQIEGQRTNRSLGLGEWLKLAAAITGATAGIIAFFSLTGFVITLSFVNELGLYGIPKFPEEFFKEAGVQFFRDFVVVLGESTWHFPIFIFFLIALLWLATATGKIITRSKEIEVSVDSKRRKTFWRAIEKMPIFLLLFMMLAITYVALRLKQLFADIEWRERYIYLAAVPTAIALGLYLVIHITEITRPSEWKKNAYGAFLVLFIVLMIYIPFGYGRCIYDFPVYFVNSFEYYEKYDSESMKKFRNAVNEGGARSIYYLMGHTSGKEVFFQSEKPPAELVLLDSEAVKFLRISKEVQWQPMTIRSVLKLLDVKDGELGGQKIEDINSIWFKLKK